MFVFAAVCLTSLSAVCNVFVFCYFSLYQQLKCHSFFVSLSSFPLNTWKPPLHPYHTLPLFLPIVEAVLTRTQKLYLYLTSASTAPPPVLSSSILLICSSWFFFEWGTLLADTAHFSMGSTAGRSQHQEQMRWLPFWMRCGFVGGILLLVIHIFPYISSFHLILASLT